jgi:hypothetical protein
LRIRAGGREQVDRVRLTAGFHTQVSPTLHFGLGDATSVEWIEVRWPSKAKADQPFSLSATVRTLAGKQAPLATPGRPTVINFWAP